ncbi:Bug family tripartite tricarboxylate transporter substrate binding protein [Caldovatus aquaticus]|uniref:Tripartite tricarboxylate transporter substrate binding protein n=1 Tax=Caldovatus aquaticus TaxID=2865671 RepID=A0ABS7EY64_9PROT|nr:tripartite tricarboxylate transporter substrate-binding protein [Caldovatus aquaticus]MBW8268048.1 tripartite tricarboxylate transporter substrate binding protein [Caldovatus aquaticus]
MASGNGVAARRRLAALGMAAGVATGAAVRPLPAAPARSGDAAAARFPDRPVRILVPFAAGGTTDLIARALAERLAARFGQPVAVDNWGGGGGAVAGETFARSEPDGHTLLVATASLIAINKALRPDLPFDPETQFVLIAMLAQQPNVLVVNPRALPQVRTLPELIAQAKARPGQLTYASAGAGTQLHLTGAMLAAEAGIAIVHVPYRGAGPALADLIAGQVTMMFDGLGSVLPHLRAGTLRAVAVAGEAPHPALPGVKPVAATLPGFLSVNWTGLFGLRGTPEPVVERLAAETRKALETPEVRRLFAERAFDPMPIPRAALPVFLEAERRRWGEAVRRSGARVE